MKFFNRKKLLCLTAMATFHGSAVVPLCQAFLSPHTISRTHSRGVVDSVIPTIDNQKMTFVTSTTTSRLDPNQAHSYKYPTTTTTTVTRLYGSSRRNEQGFLEKAKDAVKKFLPTKWFGTEEEKAALARRKEVEEQVSEMFKDAPLVVRMLGKMVTPLVSTMASTMAEQQKTSESLVRDAKRFLLNDPVVVGAMGETITVGAPFSQSSSTTIVNGISQTRIELAMPVNGSNNSGIVRLLANQNGIVDLRVDVSGGRRINVSLSSSSSSSRIGGGGSSSKISGRGDDIIEAEIIEKKTRY